MISRITSGVINPIATLESDQPEITVEAIGMADPASDNINQYTVRFKVESTEAIPDIDDPASYVVLRIPTGGVGVYHRLQVLLWEPQRLIRLEE